MDTNIVQPMPTELDVGIGNDDDISKLKRRKKLAIILRQVAKEVLANSTSHGIPNILRNDNLIIKLFWGFFFLLSTALCAFLVAQSIFAYLSYEVTAKIRTFYESPAPFPTIIICNKQRYSTDFVLEHIKQLIKDKNYTDIFDESSLHDFDYWKKDASIKEILIALNRETFIKNFTDEKRKKLQYTFYDDIIFECTYNGLRDNCNISHFTWSYDKVYGNCHTINSDLNNSTVFKYSNFYGIIYGLSLTLFLGIKKELKVLNPSKGLTLLIKNTSHTFESKTVDLAPGVETNIQLERHFATQLPKPYSNCDIDNDNPKNVDSKLYKDFLKSNMQYSQQYCLELCFQRLVIQECGCTDFYSISLEDVDICNPNAYDCVDQVYDKFTYDNFFNQICLPLCPLQCNQTSFKVSTSSNQLVTEYYSQTVKNKANQLNITDLDLDDVKNSIIRFNIYFDSLSYTLISESAAMDVVALLSNIGGTMGLFLGVSVLTFMELFEICLLAFFHKN
jgi:hypothetical protein